MDKTYKRFNAALRLVGEHRIACEVEGEEDDFAEEISLGIVANDGVVLFPLCSLPVASDACVFGDDDEQDYEFDMQYRSLGKMFASSPEMYKMLCALEEAWQHEKAHPDQTTASRFFGLLESLTPMLDGLATEQAGE